MRETGINGRNEFRLEEIAGFIRIEFMIEALKFLDFYGNLDF